MKTKKMVFLGLMVGYSLVLYILETYIPIYGVFSRGKTRLD